LRRVAAVLLLAGRLAFASEPANLAVGQVVERQISRMQAHEYSIAMHAGEYAGFLLRHRGIDFTARAVAPDGTTVELKVPQRPGDEATAGFVASHAGSHRLQIRASYLGTAGLYAVGLAEIRQATDHDRRLYEALTLGNESERLADAKRYREATAAAARAAEVLERELGPQDVIRIWLSTFSRPMWETRPKRR